MAALFFIAVTGYTSLAFHGLITAEQAHIPIWSPLVGWFGELGARYLDVSLIRSPDNALANPASYFLLPLPVLLLLGARWRELGFGRGHRTGRVLLLWCAIPAAFWLAQMAAGALSVLALAQRLIGHTLQNGPFEEFLFHGALQSRLALLLGTPWALVGQALVYALLVEACERSIKRRTISAISIALVARPRGFVKGWLSKKK